MAEDIKHVHGSIGDEFCAALREVFAENKQLKAAVKLLEERQAKDALDGQAALDESNNEILRLKDEIEKLSTELEHERLRLAACATAALQNTREGQTRRLERSSPCWSASYHEVCCAVDREIEHREMSERRFALLVQAESQLRAARIDVQNALIKAGFLVPMSQGSTR